jgi:hypothetical protein
VVDAIADREASSVAGGFPSHVGRVAKNRFEGNLRVQIHAFAGQFAGFDAFGVTDLRGALGCGNSFE